MKYFKITRSWVVKAEDEAEAFKLVAANPTEYLDSETVTRTEYKKPQQKTGWGQTLKDQWQHPSQGKPIVATSHLFSQVSLAGLLEIWNEYVVWRKNVMPSLPEADQLFSTTMNGEKVWLLEDGEAFTMLYPEDY